MKKHWFCDWCLMSFTAKHSKQRHMQNVCHLRQEGVPVDSSTELPKQRVRYRKKDPESPGGPLLPSGTIDKDASVGKTTTGLSADLKGLVDLLVVQNKKLQEELEARIDKKCQQLVSCTIAPGVGGGDGNADQKEPKIDIVCLAKGDYIKKLIDLHDGDEEKAMNYIKNVGIATDFLEGDFRLIKKVYFDGRKKSEFPVRIKDYKRNKLEYLEENGEWVLDIRGEIVGKRLCENIVATLLIANTQFNEVIINEQDEDRKEILLDLFQINKTQAHIMKLLERKTQGKVSRRVAEFINYCAEVQAETGSLNNVKKAYN